MTKTTSLDGKWNLSWIENKRYVNEAPNISSIADLKRTGYPTIEATVPGNFELDFFRAGIIDDPYYSVNTHKCQKFENLHLFYFRKFEYDGKNGTLVFEGIDTIAEIYVNGKLIGHADDMLIPFAYEEANLVKGENEILVHITPAHIEARKFPVPVSSFGHKYSYDNMYIRKAPHMYGWDIMPRMLSGGIWRHVRIEDRSPDRIDDLYLYLERYSLEDSTAFIHLMYNVTVSEDSIQDYGLKIEGKCGDSSFTAYQDQLWHTGGRMSLTVSGCKFWWPRNYGEPNLYETTATLYYKGQAVDTYVRKFGIRSVRLDRTSLTDKDGNGEFCFNINGKRVFVLGTNWVPVDAMHSNDEKRLPEILPMLNDIGCNMVRCWGGNVYENDYFYDFCDANGIMVWQDFSMACSLNPQDEYFCGLLKREVEIIVKRLRNHASLVLWAGDNEVDWIFSISLPELTRDPNRNVLTRKIIPEVLWVHDFSRPYLPSSPYIDETVFSERAHEWKTESHLWGPRDYFKGEYYRNTQCHFASETGYHGCNSPESLKKFISPDQLWPWKEHPDDKYARPDWLAHASCVEVGGRDGCAYRIPLMAKQVATLFGREPDTLEDFARASQISQAEAKKYFIERFRVTKWRRTGIIWWNLIDGWPQISDAVVDYYYSKKLAYHYIKRSQQPVCMIFDEPEGKYLPLHLVNDSRQTVDITYRVTDITDDKFLMQATASAEPDDNVLVWNMEIQPGEKKFYLIEWSYTDHNGSTITGKNHYMTNILDISYEEYLRCMKKCGFYEEFVGF